MIKKLRLYFFRILLFLCILSIGLTLTGAIERDYDVLSAGHKFNATRNFSAVQMAAKFVPDIFCGQQLDLKDLDQLYFEIINDKNTWVINYYFKWNSKTPPDIWQNLLTKITNIIYYRFVFVDIKTVQVTVAKNSFKATEWKFKNGIIKHPVFGDRLELKSWDHEFSILKSVIGKKVKLHPTPVYFTNSEYKYLKMARRDQGDYRTKEGKTNIPIIIFLAGLATYYFRYIQKDYSRSKD